MVADLTREQKLEKLMLHEELKRRKAQRKLWSYYPDTGPLRRELYVKHMAFFEAGAQYRERGFIAANRVGKTEGVGGYEEALHLTGLYPEWWKGRRFNRPVSAWAAGSTGKTTRDILQRKLLGKIDEIGTGLIPGKCIVGTPKRKVGIPDAIETVLVNHKLGGTSILQFKSYEEKRKGFEGTEQDVILLDEEPDEGIYAECLVRTMTTDGLVMLTMTPLNGLSAVVLKFLPGGKQPETITGRKWVIMASWDDAPHLTEKDKNDLLGEIPAYQRQARTKGVPVLGSGVIYPVAEEEIGVTDFEVPHYWKKAFALDVGWNCTAALWGAWDLQNDTIYLYSAYKRGEAEPPTHVAAIKSRGAIPGVVDPAARGRNQKDGTKLIDEYRGLGLDLSPANHAVEAGIFEVWHRLSTGRLKVFRSLGGWFDEARIYRRDLKGAVVKNFDHYMDDTRYLVMSGLDVARAEAKPPEKKRNYVNRDTSQTAWMGM